MTERAEGRDGQVFTERRLAERAVVTDRREGKAADNLAMASVIWQLICIDGHGLALRQGPAGVCEGWRYVWAGGCAGQRPA